MFFNKLKFILIKNKFNMAIMNGHCSSTLRFVTFSLRFSSSATGTPSTTTLPNFSPKKKFSFKNNSLGLINKTNELLIVKFRWFEVREFITILDLDSCKVKDERFQEGDCHSYVENFQDLCCACDGSLLIKEAKGDSNSCCEKKRFQP